MRPHKLMVVDDSMVFRNRIARLAADPRLPRVQLVAMAENGEEAIAQARHHRPDLVTMDLTMPRMDGPACLEVLREQLPEARILVVSALSDRDLMDMAGSELDFFKQKVSQLTTDLSRTLENLNGLMETNADNIAGTLGNLNSVTGDMAEILSAEKNSLKSALDNLSKFSDMLGENAGRVDS